MEHEFMKVNESFVDTKFSSLVAPNFYDDNVLINGLTYSNKYTENAAGEIMVHKLQKGSVTARKVGGRFTAESLPDELINIPLDIEFSKSREIFGVTDAMTAYSRVAAEVEIVAGITREAKQLYALATLVGNAGKTVTETLTSENADDAIIAVRKYIKDQRGHINAIILSTEVYALLLQSTEKKITPIVNEDLRARGVVNQLYGIALIECNALDSEVTLIDGSKVDLTGVNMIGLAADAFSIIDVLTASRVLDGRDFVGKEVQLQVNTGMKVTNPELVYVSKKA